MYQVIAIACSCNMSGKKTCVRQNKSGIAGTRHPMMTTITTLVTKMRTNCNVDKDKLIFVGDIFDFRMLKS